MIILFLKKISRNNWTEFYISCFKHNFCVQRSDIVVLIFSWAIISLNIIDIPKNKQKCLYFMSFLEICLFFKVLSET